MNEPKNIAVSARQQLLNLSRSQGVEFQRTLVRYAIERLLYRLSQHPAQSRFILKGAMLFITWPERIFRPSGDLDLLGAGPSDVASMRGLFKEICAIEGPTDGIRYDLASIVVDVVRDNEDEYQGVRIRLDAHLDSAVIPVFVDVGFGDHIYPAPREIRFPCLLPDMPVPRILAYPAETVIAEKFEAMVRYGEATSRLKDFYDIWTISRTFSFQKAALVQAIRGTLERRETAISTEFPFPLTPEFAAIPEKKRMWEGFLRRNPPASAPPPLEELMNELRQFLGPVLASIERPEAATGEWTPESGWSS